MALQLTKKTWGAIAAAAALALSAAAVTVGDAADDKIAEALAGCMVASASNDRLFQLGEALGGSGNLAWRAADALGCSGFLTFVTNADFKKTVSTASTPLLYEASAFREGVYGGFGIGFQLDAQERLKLGKVGSYLEHGLRPAATAKLCGALPPEGADYLEAIVYPFTLAAVGNQATSLNDEQVYKVAELVLQSAKDFAMHGLDETYDCSAENNVNEIPKLVPFLEDMTRFRKGTHTMAPGCHAEVLLSEITLRCDGADKPRQSLLPLK